MYNNKPRKKIFYKHFDFCCTEYLSKVYFSTYFVEKLNYSKHLYLYCLSQNAN